MTEEEEADVSAMLDLSLSKKKKKKKIKKSSGTTTSKKTETADAEAAPAADTSDQQRLLLELDQNQELGNEDDRRAEYTYDELLDRVVDLLQANNPDLMDKKRTKIQPPQLTSVSSKKTLWVNFQEICNMMQRDPQHVYQFFMVRSTDHDVLLCVHYMSFVFNTCGVLYTF